MNFVLVHGAFHGGWCYRDVADILRSLGHRVFTPTLTGVGERRHVLTDSVGLTTHIRDITELITFEELDDVVLVGHSYGGMVATGVADLMPQAIRSLVYLDAFVPEHGQALAHLAPLQAWAELLGAGPPMPGDMLPPFTAAVMGVLPENQDRVDRLCTPQSALTVLEPVELKGGLDSITRKVFLYAEGWNDLSGFHQRLPEFRERGWIVETTRHGHDMMIDAPEETAEFLVRVA